MSPLGPRRIDVSVRDRLLNIAKQESRDFNNVLNLYYQERFLARLSASRFRNLFLLKGGLLLFCLATSNNLLLRRPTKDLDLEGSDIGNDEGRLRAVIADVCSLELPDGLEFDAGGITSEQIAENATYHGVRLKVPVTLAGARGRVQIDVGFGDIVTPRPRERVFDSLLKDMPPLTLMAYPLETVVAEKLEIMISRSVVNSRMKDFFDLHQLACSEPFVGTTLQQAVTNTFGRRGTQFVPSPPVFEETFGLNEMRRSQWTVFLRQSRLAGAPQDLPEVLEAVRDFLQPIYSACVEGCSFTGQWVPEILKWQ